MMMTARERAVEAWNAACVYNPGCDLCIDVFEQAIFDVVENSTRYASCCCERNIMAELTVPVRDSIPAVSQQVACKTSKDLGVTAAYREGEDVPPHSTEATQEHRHAD